MSFSLPRAAILFLISLPVGFILTALAFVVLQQPVAPVAIFLWAVGLALISGLIAGFQKPTR